MREANLTHIIKNVSGNQFRDVVSTFKIEEFTRNGKYFQKLIDCKKLICCVKPLTLHQRQNGFIDNFFVVICNIDTETFDLCLWNDKYLKIQSYIHPIQNSYRSKYGYFLSKEVHKDTIMRTDNIKFEMFESTL
ncbi:MAG: hypothetical protein H6845_02465 [Alphaproteobacteria bacterium]|nr:MAG: hypothetical protein H6845_02465 [Alphaproteobacteria bacterium]